MISILQGTIDSRGADHVVVMTDGGVGFQVFVPSALAASIGANGGRVRFYTHLAVREDAMQLFGFESAAQRAFFLKLISINGVGPKAALALLTSMSVQEILSAVATNDVKCITRAQRIGKKIAERIILELRGQLDTFVESTQAAAVARQTGNTAQAEAVQALMSLGYTGAEAMEAVAKVGDEAEKTEEIIMCALRMLDQN